MTIVVHRGERVKLFNPLTAGAVHIGVLHFILVHYISAFKPDKNKN